MTAAQKLAAWLFKWDYVMEVWGGVVDVRRARKVGHYWVIGACRIIKPGGVICDSNFRWEPLTARVARFYCAETL